MDKNKLKKLSDSYVAAHAQLKTVKDEAIKELKNSVAEIFKKYPKLQSFSLYASNHEFNDGDATTFYLMYDESIRLTIDGADDAPYYDKQNEFYPIYKELRDVYSEFDAFDIYEDLYGDQADEFEIERGEYTAN